MTEAEWLRAEDSWPMIQFLAGRSPTERKIHLFVCGFCRLVVGRDASLSSDVRAAVSVAERFADGLATKDELCWRGNG